MVVYLLSFRKIQLESKNTLGVVPAEDFREQQNIWKGSPAFPDGMFQTEIRVDTFDWFAPFFGKWNRFVEICTNGKSDSWAKFSCWEGRLEGFKVSLWILNITKLIEYRTEQLRNATIFIIVVDGCIIIHDSRGCHVQFYLMKQSLTVTTWF